MADSLSTIELKIWINASPADVFDSWVRAETLSRWFQHEASSFDETGASTAVASTGDRYEWTMVHGHVSRGRFLEVNPPALARLTFGRDTDMTFTVQPEPSDNGTLLRLTHQGIPADDIEMHTDIRTAWTFFLTNLKAYLEHGIDLREHDAARIRQGVLNI